MMESKSSCGSTRLRLAVPELIVCCCAVFLFVGSAPQSVQAQTLTKLLDFNRTNGANPLYPVLAQGVDGNFHGTTSTGGAHGKGTVFKVTSNGTLTTLYSFCAKSNCTDGSTPYAGLVLATDGNFYGTTFVGGTHNIGTIFKITPSGRLTTLHSFDFSDGFNPYAGVIQATDGNFYGTTANGGAHLVGNVYKMTPQGVVTSLHSFNSSDGSTPEAGVIQGSDGNFYGTTYNGGGPGSYGTIFKITSTGVLTTLHFFNDTTDGRQIVSGLVEGTDGNFYGTSGGGGPFGDGTFYSITPAGVLTVLHDLGGNDGISCNQLLLGTDGNFYGTTFSGGTGGGGTILEITPQGTVTTLHDFSSTDGTLPFAGPAQGTDGNLYGVTQFGGAKNDGTFYRLGVGLGAFVKTVPAAGKVGANVTILGTSLTGATGVTFNGVPATFKVVSANEITTTVPAGATTGTVQVNTPGGSLLSNPPFVVTP